MSFSELEHPWRRIAALAVSCFSGVSASLLAGLAILRGHRALWPSFEVKSIDLMAQPGSTPWASAWTHLIFGAAFGMTALLLGYLVGSGVYEWLARRYRLRRRRDGA